MHVDLDSDALFASTDEVTSDIDGDAGVTLVSAARGRDSARLLAPPRAGSMVFSLNNQAGSYDPADALSIGQRCRWRATWGGTTYDLFRGLLDEPEQQPQAGLQNRVSVHVRGMLSTLVGKQVSLPLYEDIDTGTAAGHLLDAAGFPKNAQPYLTDQVPAGQWGLGETSGAAVDLSGNGNDGTVTTGAGTRGDTALDDAGDGALVFDGAATKVEVADDAAIQDIFDGGGSVAFLANVTSDGEGSVGRVLDKAAWYLDVQDESGGNVRLNFRVGFSGTEGIWQTAVNVPLATVIAGVLTYNADDVANNPTLYLWTGTTWATLTVGAGLTETSTPVGTRTTDVGSALEIGNNAAASATFDGVLDEVAVFTSVLTSAQAAAWVSRVLDAPRHISTGRTVLSFWPCQEIRDAKRELDRLQVSEGPGAAVYEDGTGAVVFKDRWSILLDARSTTSQGTLSTLVTASEPRLASPFTYDPGNREKFQRCTTTVKTRVAQALGEVWALGSTVTLGANETRTYAARGEDGDPITAATVPTTGGGDYTVSAGSLVSVTLERTSGLSIGITLVAGPAGATVTGLRLRGQRVMVTSETLIEDQIGITGDFLPSYPLDIHPEVSPTVAQDFCDAVVGFYRNGRPRVTATLETLGADARMDQAMAREIHDRVRVVEGNTGIDLQAFVHTISQVVVSPSRLITTFACEEAIGGGFILDTSELVADGATEGDVLWW
ncbi:MAG: hypothetical protein CVU47_10715 [Chloroflexi bacterium HGW-Chloroflexi-9]|nr:MAG: hypothetical protein CVU47_10715 [Chloroflexi bacterium HGW-Chloroflexi-9]